MHTWKPQSSSCSVAMKSLTQLKNEFDWPLTSAGPMKMCGCVSVGPLKAACVLTTAKQNSMVDRANLPW